MKDFGRGFVPRARRNGVAECPPSTLLERALSTGLVHGHRSGDAAQSRLRSRAHAVGAPSTRSGLVPVVQVRGRAAALIPNATRFSDD